MQAQTSERQLESFEAPRTGGDNAGRGNRAEELFRVVTQGTVAVTGKSFFRSLVERLASGLHARFSFVAECMPKKRARSLAFWKDGDFGEDFEYALPGTPCMQVSQGRTCQFPDHVPELFPEDKGMIDLGTVSYLGVPLFNQARQVIGHIVVFDDKPMPPDPLAISVVEMFAARAGAELEREQARRELGALLKVNRAIGRHLDRDELFGALAECLLTVLQSERFGIELPVNGDKLQAHILGPTSSTNCPKRTCSEVLPAAGTVCHWVEENRMPFVGASRDNLREKFPVTFEVMEREGMQSLCALPLITAERCRGVLFFMDSSEDCYGYLHRNFLEQVSGAVAVALDDCLAHEEVRRLGEELAAQKVAQLEQQKQHISHQLQQAHEALRASEERFRDLFDEAPIAYVHEGLDSRFIRVNRTAMRILGIKPEEIEGTYGKSFVPDTPDAQRRVHQALESIGRGTDTSGVLLELRRKDNDKPIWIQWWSRPDPSGTYTRTMFIDITDRVLMEQEKTRLEAQNIYLQEEIRREHNFDEIIGNSRSLLRVLDQIEQVASTDSTVLILGETGTGKELFARAIHERSRRKARPLVKVNCAAISAGLVESELFGHVKGAFTGALTNRDGRFKLADGGTIFLDEVGELPLDVQVKLLRVLQEQEFEPVGSSQTIRVDVRIIAATNRDLSAWVNEGKFRRDLFYRLNVLPLTLPPLREREGDVPLLVAFFTQHFAKKHGKPVKQIPEEAMRRLANYPWPGNIRELQNVIERAVVLSQGETLTLAAGFGPPPIPAGSTPTSALDRNTAQSDHPKSPQTTVSVATGGSLAEMECRHIESVLQQANWMIEGDRGAAKILNLHPSTLRSRMKKLGLKRPV